MIIRTENYVVKCTLENVDNKIVVKAFGRQTCKGYQLDEAQITEGSYGCQAGDKLFMFHDSGSVRADASIYVAADYNVCSVSKISFSSSAACRAWLRQIKASLQQMEVDRLIVDTEIQGIKEEYSQEEI